MTEIQKSDLKLTIELVPASAWYKNLRNVVGQAQWDKIRKKSYADANYKCGICGASDKLSCHEIWNYDDKTRIQRLDCFIALCSMCHHVKHIGLAQILAQRGRLNFQTLITHFCVVNSCDTDTFYNELDNAYAVWKRRSHYKWVLDLNGYDYLIRQKPIQKPDSVASLHKGTIQSTLTTFKE